MSVTRKAKDETPQKIDLMDALKASLARGQAGLGSDPATLLAENSHLRERLERMAGIVREARKEIPLHDGDCWPSEGIHGAGCNRRKALLARMYDETPDAAARAALAEEEGR